MERDAAEAADVAMALMHFATLKPACVAVLQAPHGDAKDAPLRRLHALVAAHDAAPGVWAKLTENLCFPLVMTLKAPETPQRQRELCLETVATVVERSDPPPRQANMLLDMLTTATLHAHGQLGADADETRLAAVRLLAALLRPLLEPTPALELPEWSWAPLPPRPAGAAQAPMVGPAAAIAGVCFDGRGTPAAAGGGAAPRPGRPPHLAFAHAVSALLDASEPGHATALQLQALAVLGRLAGGTLGSPAARAAGAAVLPGVVSGLVRLLLHDPKAPHRRQTAALGALTAWVAAAFDGGGLDRREAPPPPVPEPATAAAAFAKLAERARTTAAGAAGGDAAPAPTADASSGPPSSPQALVADKVGSALQRLLPPLRAASHAAVRRAVAAAAEVLLRAAGSYFSDATTQELLDTLLTLAEDDDASGAGGVPERARAALDAALALPAAAPRLRDLLVTGADRLLRALPRQVLSPTRSDPDKAAALRRARAYLSAVGAAAGVSLQTTLGQGAWGWLAMLALSTTAADAPALVLDRGGAGASIDALAAAPATAGAARDVRVWTFPRRRYVHVRDDAAAHALETIFALFGRIDPGGAVLLDAWGAALVLDQAPPTAAPTAAARPPPLAAALAGLDLANANADADADASAADGAGEASATARCTQAVLALLLALRGATAAAAVAAEYDEAAAAAVRARQTAALAAALLEAVLNLPVWNEALSYADAVARERFRQAATLGAPAGAPAASGGAVVPRTPTALTLAQLQETVWLRVTALEALAGVAGALGRRFRPHLVRALFPILESLQEPNAAVAAAAAAALAHVAVACGYADARALLLGNADYIVHATSQRLRHLDRHPSVAPVLSALLQQAGAAMIPMMHDAWDHILLALDRFHTEPVVSVALVHVLHTAMRVVLLAQPATAAAPATEPSPPRPTSSVSATQSALLDYPVRAELVTAAQPDGELQAAAAALAEHRRLRTLPLADRFLGKPVADAGADAPGPATPAAADEEITAPASGQPPVEPDPPKPPLPPGPALAQRVLERLPPLLASPEVSVRSAVCDVLALAITVLGSADTSALLPLLHQLWPPLVRHSRPRHGARRLARMAAELPSAPLCGRCGSHVADPGSPAGRGRRRRAAGGRARAHCGDYTVGRLFGAPHHRAGVAAAGRAAR